MWIAVNNHQMRVYPNFVVDKQSTLNKLYTYCPHGILRDKSRS